MVSSSYTMRINISPPIVLMFTSIIGLTLMISCVIYSFLTFTVNLWSSSWSRILLFLRWRFSSLPVAILEKELGFSISFLHLSPMWPRAVTTAFIQQLHLVISCFGTSTLLWLCFLPLQVTIRETLKWSRINGLDHTLIWRLRLNCDFTSREFGGYVSCLSKSR